MKLPTFKRLGLWNLATDHFRTLVEWDDKNEAHTSKSDVFIFLILPILAGVFTYLVGGHMRAPSEMIAGVVIITGLLFGLLAHVLGLGMKVANDDRYTHGDRIVILLNELRANVSWAIAIGLLLNTILVVLGTFGGDQTASNDHGYAPWVSGVIIALFVHLMLTLLMVLNRVRSTYKLLGK